MEVGPCTTIQRGNLSAAGEGDSVLDPSTAFCYRCGQTFTLPRCPNHKQAPRLDPERQNLITRMRTHGIIPPDKRATITVGRRIQLAMLEG